MDNVGKMEKKSDINNLSDYQIIYYDILGQI